MPRFYTDVASHIAMGSPLLSTVLEVNSDFPCWLRGKASPWLLGAVKASALRDVRAVPAASPERCVPVGAARAWRGCPGRSCPSAALRARAAPTDGAHPGAAKGAQVRRGGAGSQPAGDSPAGDSPPGQATCDSPPGTAHPEHLWPAPCQDRRALFSEGAPSPGWFPSGLVPAPRTLRSRRTWKLWVPSRRAASGPRGCLVLRWGQPCWGWAGGWRSPAPEGPRPAPLPPAARGGAATPSGLRGHGAAPQGPGTAAPHGECPRPSHRKDRAAFSLNFFWLVYVCFWFVWVFL